MKQIIVDGKKYYLATDVDTERKKDTTKKTDKLIFRTLFTNPCCVLGMGSAKLSGDWVGSKINVDFLIRTIKIIKEMQVDAVTLMWTKDHPVIFGVVDEKKQEVSGLFLSPRVEK